MRPVWGDHHAHLPAEHPQLIHRIQRLGFATDLHDSRRLAVIKVLST